MQLLAISDAVVPISLCGAKKVGHSKPFRVTRGSYELLFFPFAFLVEARVE